MFNWLCSETQMENPHPECWDNLVDTKNGIETVRNMKWVGGEWR